MIPSLSGLESLVPLVVLVSIRVGVVFASLPAPFGSIAPATVRAALSVLIALALALAYNGLPIDADFSQISTLSIVVGEALVGAVIGLTVRVILAATEIAGTLIGNTVGLGFAGSVDPEFGHDALPTTRLIALLGTLVFFAFRGHHTVLEALATSLSVAPPGRVFSVLARVGMVRLGSDMLARGLQISAPVLGTMFIIQLGTGLASKAAPRVHFMTFVFGISAATGLVALFVASPSIMTAIAVEIRHLPAALAAALGAR
jgi:flagellar biosynthetic protein FliR